MNGDEQTLEAVAARSRYTFAADYLKMLITVKVLKKSPQVLDFACGTGFGTSILRNEGMDAWGWNPDVAEVAWGRIRWTNYLVDDLNAINDKSWNAIVCMNWLLRDNLPWKDMGQNVLNNFLIKPGCGHLLMGLPFGEDAVTEATFNDVDAKLDFYYQHPSGVVSNTRSDVENLIVCATRKA